MMKTLLILINLLMITTSSIAQLSIRLAGKKNNEPVAGAVIDFINKSGTVVGKQFTNVKGITIHTSDNSIALIRIRALGYIDTTLLVEAAEIVVLLEELPLQKGEIVITAQRHASVSQDVPVSISTADSKEILSRSPKEVDEVLRFIPGVTVTEDQVSIRGSSGYSRAVGSRVLYMMDGMPMLSADNGDIKFDAIPMMNIQSIEVVKGSGSALYGSSALGGIINVITRKPTQTWLAALSTSIGTYSAPTYKQWDIDELNKRFLNIEGGLSNTFGEVGLLASAAYKRDEGYRQGDDTYNGVGFIKLQIPTSDNSELIFTTLYSYNNHGNWLYWKDLSNVYKPADSLSAVNERITSTKLNLYGAYKALLNDEVTLDIKGTSFHTRYSTDPLNEQDSIDPGSIAMNNIIDAQSGYYLFNDLFLTNGITIGHQHVTSNVSGNHYGVNFGIYAQGEYTLKPLILTVGVRGDIYQYDTATFIGSISPKAGVSWITPIGISMRASFGTGFRAPSITEKYTDQVLNGFTIKPNYSLEPERSYSGEIGGQYRDEHFMIDGAVFYSKFSKLIEPGFVKSGLQTYIQFTNITDANIYGHEEVVEYTPFASEVLKLRLAYTYIYPFNSSNNSILNFRPRHLLQSRVEMKKWDLSASVDFRFVSQYESIDPILVQQVPDATARIAAYVLDGRIGYSFQSLLSIPMTATFQCQNLLNHYYVEMVGNMAPPRSVSLKLESIF